MDADEYLTPAGRHEIRAATRDGVATGYLLPRAQIFLGRRLEHAWWYPDYQLRLFRVCELHFSVARFQDENFRAGIDSH